MNEVKPPKDYKWYPEDMPRVFLAGSIEMGTAENWQARVAKELEEYNIVLLNPRRDNWDASWKQTLDSPKFVEQVNWELDGQERADYILMYFDPNTKAPITLMELGLFADKEALVIVCCPDGFWRKGNVQIVCERNGISCHNTFEEMMAEIKTELD